jgi:hypothetical protein
MAARTKQLGSKRGSTELGELEMDIWLEVAASASSASVTRLPIYPIAYQGIGSNKRKWARAGVHARIYDLGHTIGMRMLRRTKNRGKSNPATQRVAS